MSTTDVFQRAVTAMSSFVAVPLHGEVERFNVTGYDVTACLDGDPQSAQALLAWLGSLTGAGITGLRLSHHHANGKVFVTVQGKRDGLFWDIYASFEGDDAAVLCEHSENHDGYQSSMPVHRLRLVQMRQLAAAVAR